MSEVTTICFSIEGEVLTNRFREKWVETDYDAQIPIDFMDSVVGMNLQQVGDILGGKKKLIGSSRTEDIRMADDACPFICGGMPLKTIDRAKIYRKAKYDALPKLMSRIAKEMIRLADNGETMRNTGRNTRIGGAIAKMLPNIAKEEPAFFAQICIDNYSLDLDLMIFIRQLVPQFSVAIEEVSNLMDKDLLTDYDTRMQQAERTINKREKERMEAREQEEKEDAEDDEEVREMPESNFLMSESYNMVAKMRMMGIGNADKYQEALQNQAKGIFLKELESPEDLKEVQYGTMAVDGTLYKCAFFQHGELEHLMKDAGLWTEEAMIHLKDGPTIGDAPIKKQWCHQGDIPASPAQLNKMIEWCRVNSVNAQETMKGII